MHLVNVLICTTLNVSWASTVPYHIDIRLNVSPFKPWLILLSLLKTIHIFVFYKYDYTRILFPTIRL